MNESQRLWLQQAQSDHDVLLLLRRYGAAPCHQLHYLQMVTEKLSKAYFWRSGNAPPRAHTGFVQFLRSLGSVPSSDRNKLASAFSFTRFTDLQKWIYGVLPLAYELERLAPMLANDGPNPEYPWPHNQPANSPVTFVFPTWTQLSQTSRGRHLLQFIERALKNFSTIT